MQLKEGTQFSGRMQSSRNSRDFQYSPALTNPGPIKIDSTNIFKLEGVEIQKGGAGKAAESFKKPQQQKVQQEHYQSCRVGGKI